MAPWTLRRWYVSFVNNDHETNTSGFRGVHGSSDIPAGSWIHSCPDVHQTKAKKRADYYHMSSAKTFNLPCVNSSKSLRNAANLLTHIFFLIYASAKVCIHVSLPSWRA
ncbi:unnamed protein product, partial [Ectocarpus sp. 12 AP-2014]